ncbi:CxC2 domain-containing protein [Favolaschia claudopus]|uniref:CxC2 domain-containing protein n=1 Tax=Favolaschia claudopus TaxID=2862362 RepID=A0AAV9ZWT4_9AGAR
MSFLTRSQARAANGTQRVNSYVEYESKDGDITGDSAFFSSQDGRRGLRKAMNVSPKKRKTHPSELDDLSNWTPLPENEGENLTEDSAGIGEKRKRYENSDDPMKSWKPMMQFFLDELLRREGLGDNETRCACCRQELLPAARRFRCRDCGIFLQCTDCLVYQLGHGGHPCPHPAPVARDMIVLDFPHVHHVKYRYCACDLSDRANNLQQLLRNDWYPATTVDPATCTTFATLEIFRLLSVVGGINVNDFVHTMEKNTDPWGVDQVPDRYKAFGRMSRQFACLGRLKRAGRAHDDAGVEATEKGGCAVLCWACPHEGINLPEGWRDLPHEYQFLFMLILAVDANFRLRNRLRANARDDPPLASGWGYMQEASGYKRHLRNAVPEKDISTCAAFAALAQKETRLTTGLRASGLGAVVCARHEVVRPQGLGDLQKGERYMNMDYIVLASILGVLLLYIAVCYDIVCQWKIRFRERMAAMPEGMRLDLDKTTIVFGLPVWHATAHERSCQVQNTLTFQEGVGRTDGEGTERVWSGFNALATATKEMNYGAREDAIEDKVDYHNTEKNLKQGTTLPRKLVIAIEERDRQVASFEEVDGTLKPELRQQWQGMIDAWIADRTQKNPYELDEGQNVPSEASIRLALAKEELEEAATGKATLHGSSVTSFLVMGLQLENAQDRIRRELKGRSVLAAEQSERITEQRRAFFAKLRKFRALQAIYVPAAAERLREDDEQRDPDLPPPQAEEVKLFLPSALSRGDGSTEAEGLPGKEARLREGQLNDNIRRLRSRLHAKRHLLHYRLEHLVGQRGGTRAAVLIEQVTENIEEAAARYRRAREALISLKGESACSAWKPLRDEDIRLDQDREVDALARERLGGVGSKGSRKSTRATAAAISSRQKKMSWIWTQGGGPDADEEELAEAVRVEWATAKARRDRWSEEVDLLREEMRRVLRFLRWRAVWWEEHRVVERVVSPEVKKGLQAYASQQAAMTRQISRQFKQSWETSASQAVRVAMENDAMLGEIEGESAITGREAGLDVDAME